MVTGRPPISVTFTNGNASFFRYPSPKEPLKGLLLEEMNITPVGTVTGHRDQVILQTQGLHGYEWKSTGLGRCLDMCWANVSYEIRIEISRYTGCRNGQTYVVYSPCLFELKVTDTLWDYCYLTSCSKNQTFRLLRKVAQFGSLCTILIIRGKFVRWEEKLIGRYVRMSLINISWFFKQDYTNLEKIGNWKSVIDGI